MRLSQNLMKYQCFVMNLVLNLFQYWLSILTKSMAYDPETVQGDTPGSFPELSMERSGPT